MTGPAPATLIKVHVGSFLIWLITIVAHVVARTQLREPRCRATRRLGLPRR